MEPFPLLYKQFVVQLLVLLSYSHYLYSPMIFSLAKLYSHLFVFLTNLLLIISTQLKIVSLSPPSFSPLNHHQNHLKNYQIISFFSQFTLAFFPSSLLSMPDVLHEITLLNFSYFIQQRLMVWLFRNLLLFWVEV